MRHLFALLLCVTLLLPLSTSAAPLKACLKTDTGKVVIKRRCREARGQQLIDAEVLQGLGASQVGPKGDTGDPGPTAGSFFHGSPVAGGLAKNLTTSMALMTDLANTNGATSATIGGQIKVDFPAIIYAQTAAEVRHAGSTGSTYPQAQCRLRISDGSGPLNGLANMGEFPRFSFSPYTNAYRVTAPLVGSAVKPAGTYNVVVECAEVGSTGNLYFDAADIIVWAVAQ